MSHPFEPKTPSLISVTAIDLDTLAVLLMLDEYVNPPPMEQAPVKYAQLVSELKPHQMRNCMMYICQTYPDIFKTLLTCVLSK